MSCTPERQANGKGELRDCRVLVVDDDRDCRFLLVKMLERVGAHVTLAEDGQEAVVTVWACESGRRKSDPDAPFDLILMDIQMPVMDGYEATRELRRRGHTMPIIAVTASGKPTVQAECLEAGCDAYVAKPFRMDALLSLLTATL